MNNIKPINYGGMSSMDNACHADSIYLREKIDELIKRVNLLSDENERLNSELKEIKKK